MSTTICCGHFPMLSPFGTRYFFFLNTVESYLLHYIQFVWKNSPFLALSKEVITPSSRSGCPRNGSATDCNYPEVWLDVSFIVEKNKKISQKAEGSQSEGCAPKGSTWYISDQSVQHTSGTVASDPLVIHRQADGEPRSNSPVTPRMTHAGGVRNVFCCMS